MSQPLPPAQQESRGLRDPRKQHESQAPQSPVYPPPPVDPAGYPPPGAMALTPSASTAQTLEMRRPEPLTSLPPENPRPRNRVWEAIKWPVRKLLLGVYYLVAAMRRRPREALVVSALLLALIVTGGVVYAVTRPGPPPVNIEQPAPPALAPSVVSYLHASQHFDAAEMWDSLDPSARTQLKVTEAQIQTSMNQEKAAGLTITRYIYSGGYRSPDGTSHYTVEVYASEQGQSGAFTWFFSVGANGLITQRLDVTT